MLHFSSDVGVLADRYSLAFGTRAGACIGDDISRAIGQKHWERVHLLELAKVRLHRVELLKGRKLFGRKRVPTASAEDSATMHWLTR